MNTEQELMILEQKANDAMTVAAMRGYDLPADYATYREVKREADKVFNQQPPASTYPAKASAVAKWVADTAKARADWREARAVAADLAAHANRVALRAAVDTAPAYIARVCDDFTEHLDAFRRVAAVAPRDITGHTTTEQFELHAELLRTLEALTAAALDRGRLALLADEAEHIGPEPLWLVMDPAGATSLAALGSTLATFHGRLPSTVQEWQQVDAIGLAMARQGEVAARKERFNRASFAAANAADRGMHDRTIDEALRSAS